MKKEKVLIITLYGDYNFGNKLQNFALLSVLKDFGFEVETARINYRYNDVIMNIKSFIKRNSNKVIKNKYERKRGGKFKDFSLQYLNCTKALYATNCKKEIVEYDFIVYGSDQIWNPICFGNYNLFLGGCSQKKRNIAYAASFGIDSLPENLCEDYKRGLANFSNISVREETGINIIKNLNLNLKPKLVLDPTLLIKREQWEKLEKEPEFSTEKDYILVFCLGTIPKKIEDEIRLFSKNNGFKIINIMEKKSKYFSIGPKEFLYLIHNAQVVITDSFHACVFSFIFDVSFVVFERVGGEDMMSRIEYLIQKFELENRFFKGTIENGLLHDYTNGFQILEKEQSKSLDYLTKSFALSINYKGD